MLISKSMGAKGKRHFKKEYEGVAEEVANSWQSAVEDVVSKFSQKYHEQIGKNIPENIDILLTVGRLGKIIAENAKSRIKTVRSFNNNKEVALYLKKIKQRGDVILLKASRGIKLEEVFYATFNLRGY